MKSKLILILLLLASLDVQGQQLSIDSIKYYLQHEKEDTTKIYLLGNLSDAYENTPDSSLWYAKQQQLMIAKYKGKLPGRIPIIGLNTIAWALWRVGNYPEAKAAFLKELKLSEKANDSLGMIWSYNGIGVIYRNEGSFKQAITSFRKSNSYLRSKNDLHYYYNIGEMGKCYEQLNQLDSALKYTQETYEALIRIDTAYNNGGIYTNLGTIQSKMGNNGLATEWFKLGIQTSLKAGDVRTTARTYYEIAQHFQRNNLIDSAIYYANKALKINQKQGFLIQILATSSLLTELYNAKKNIDSAFKYQSLSVATQNKMFNREKINRLQMLEFNEKLRQQELESMRLKAHEDTIHNLQLLAIAIFILTFFSAFLILSKRKVNPRAIEFMGLLALLLVFEFVALLLHPVIQQVTNDSPVLMMLVLVLIAIALVPLHHALENWVKKRLAAKPAIKRKAVHGK